MYPIRWTRQEKGIARTVSYRWGKYDRNARPEITQTVTELMDSGEFQSYWTGTETYEALKIYIDRNFDGLKEAVAVMLGNGRCKIDPSTFQNDMTTFKTEDDVLTLLVHLGYLTFDRQSSEVFIPNQEVSLEFLRA